jgi:DNA-binding transcriptional MerR regulator
MTPPVDNGMIVGASSAGLTAVVRRPGKSAGAFRTISEVATDLNVPQHVLRFWETRFAQIRPLKRAGGRRYYRPEDVDLLRRIRELLYNNGYTIKGVQRLLRDAVRQPDDETGGTEAAATAPAEPGDAVDIDALPPPAAPPQPDYRAVEAAVSELTAIRDLLRKTRR